MLLSKIMPLPIKDRNVVAPFFGGAKMDILISAFVLLCRMRCMFFSTVKTSSKLFVCVLKTIYVRISL